MAGATGGSQLAYEFTPKGSGSKSPLSPNNAVSTELKSDPTKTSELLRDISKALQSPLPSPASYVRKLESDLHAQATPHSTAATAAATPGAPAASSSDQCARDLVASLERMLQQPAATPGRAAMTALRQSQAVELPSSAAGASVNGIASYHSTSLSPELSNTTSFAAAAGHNRASTASITAAAAAEFTPALAAPTNRWRLAAERAASFKSKPSDGFGIGDRDSGRGWGWAPQEPSKLSPAADLLAEIARVVSPSSPAGSSRLLATSPSFSYAGAAIRAANSPPSSPLPFPAAAAGAPSWQQQTPKANPVVQPASASRWNAMASGGHGAAAAAAVTCGRGSPSAASPVAAFGFAAQSPAPPAGGLGGAAGRASPAAAQVVAMDAVGLPSQQFDLRPQPGGSIFEQEAGSVLEELHQFAALDQRCSADFAAGIAAEMGRLFALPA